MASASTGWSCVHSASVVSQTNTTATIRVTCYWQNKSWNYDINYVSAWVYCNGSSYKVKNNSSLNAPSNSGKYSLGSHDFTINKTTATQSISCYGKITSNSSYVSGTKTSSSTKVSVSAKPHYTVSYNANGGSGAPGSQTKWYGTNLTLSSTRPTRTGYSFAGWATSASGSVAYQPGSTYSSNASITLYAKWTANTYTVSYNANGGSGAPGSQTKTYGVNLTLSSTKPTRTNYNFLGWSTSASGSVAYQPGGTYSSNSGITLYAVWSLAYTGPRISGFTVSRCNSDGTANEAGTYIKTSFSWSTDRDVTRIGSEWRYDGNTSWTAYQTISASGKSGTVSKVLGGGWDIEKTYNFRVYVEDSAGKTYSTSLTIGSIKFPIDVKSGGTGIAFGKVAESANIADFGWRANFNEIIDAKKYIKATGGTYVHVATGGSGRNGYVLVASITLTGTYMNSPIGFTVAQRGTDLYNLEISFNNASTAAGTTLRRFVWYGRANSPSAYLAQNGSDPTWNLFIQKTESYDSIGIVSYIRNQEYMSLVNIEWSNEHFDTMPVINYKTASFGGYLPSNITQTLSSLHCGNSNAYGNYTNQWLGYYRASDGARVGWIGANSTNDMYFSAERGSFRFTGGKLIIPNTGESYTGGLHALRTDGNWTYLIGLSGSNNLNVGTGSLDSYAYGNTNIYSLRGSIMLAVDTSGSGQIKLTDRDDQYGAFFSPVSSGYICLGNSNNRFYGIYLSHSPNVSSDKRIKNNIIPISKGLKNRENIFEQLFDLLKPVSFSLNNDKSNKTHIGFVAQDVSNALNSLEVKEDNFELIDHIFFTDEETGEKKDEYGLRYEEFIALNTHMIQKANTIIQSQQKEIDDLKKQVQELQELVFSLLNKSK